MPRRFRSRGGHSYGLSGTDRERIIKLAMLRTRRSWYLMKHRAETQGGGWQKVDKLSVSFDPEPGDAVRTAAAQAGKPVSTWLAEAAASREFARAERELGVSAGGTAA